MVNYKKLKKLLIWNCKQNKKVGSQLPTATRMAEIEEIEPVPSILLPCSSCNRTFRPEALSKHAKVCEKTILKKRKKFDSAKQRLQGTDVPNFPSTSKTTKKETPVKKPQSKWREKQADLARTLNAVRKKSEPAVQIKPSDYEQCPHCERYFGPKAFDRHTEWCKEQQIKIKNHNNMYNEARERLQVRTKYRAPLTSKVLTRDKYLPRSRDPSPMSVPKVADDAQKKISGSLDRSSSLRISGRSRTVVVKNPVTSPRVLNESKITNASSLSENRNDSSASHEKTKPKIYPEATPKKKDAEKYDPFASAEQQMLELFSPDGFKSTDGKESNDPSKSVKTSPISAFAIYTPISSQGESPEMQGNQDNNNADSDGTVSPPNEKVDNRKNFSLSNLSLCSIISLDSVDCNRNTLSGKLGNRGREEVKRSSSAVETTKTRRNNTRAKLNMDQMLYGISSPDSPTSPIISDDVGNIKLCEAELLVSMLEFEKMLNSSPLPSIESSSPFCSSSNQVEKILIRDPDEEVAVKRNNKFPTSIDSAYGSLTRASGEGDTLKTEGSRFCHECGAKYPVLMAKFCCNCGIRRIAL